MDSDVAKRFIKSECGSKNATRCFNSLGRSLNFIRVDAGLVSFTFCFFKRIFSNRERSLFFPAAMRERI